jgi:hypothetical protein
MNRQIVYVVAIVAVSLTLTGPARAQQTNPEMQYYVIGEKYPKGLSDFQAFGLFRKAAGGKARYDGWVMSNLEDPDGSVVDMASVRVEGKKLAFRTKPKKSISFAFDGVFLKSGDFKRWIHSETAVVEGRVRKLRGGRTVAEGTIRFHCGSGG